MLRQPPPARRRRSPIRGLYRHARVVGFGGTEDLDQFELRRRRLRLDQGRDGRLGKRRHGRAGVRVQGEGAKATAGVDRPAADKWRDTLRRLVHAHYKESIGEVTMRAHRCYKFAIRMPRNRLHEILGLSETLLHGGAGKELCGPNGAPPVLTPEKSLEDI